LFWVGYGLIPLLSKPLSFSIRLFLISSKLAMLEIVSEPAQIARQIAAGERYKPLQPPKFCLDFCKAQNNKVVPFGQFALEFCETKFRRVLFYYNQKRPVNKRKPRGLKNFEKIVSFKVVLRKLNGNRSKQRKERRDENGEKKD